MKHIFVVGAKGFRYGGYETFIDKLTEYHKDNKKLKYHIACKYNGQGYMDECNLEGVRIINEFEFEYHNAHCFKIKVPDKIGSAQAILYDVKALEYVCKYIKQNKIQSPIIYVLSSRIGPVIRFYVRQIHKCGGQFWHNPDGRENLRTKYKSIVRTYWKLSEKLMVKYADLEICDSKNISKYLRNEYRRYNTQNIYIAYGAEIKKSRLADEESTYINWLKKHNIHMPGFVIIGRFVPENNFETMIREFMKSHVKKDLIIITNVNDDFINKLENKLQFKSDTRIKFVGTVYDQELLKKIRETSFAYLHGHEVGGTNPSLLEALSSTNLNLLLKVDFNEEVAGDAALYWTKESDSLATLIDRTEQLTEDEIHNLGVKAKERIKTAYSWDYIANKYEHAFLKD